CAAWNDSLSGYIF
nr:immunoglobulin light chain junction region [Macaca mulatta]MPO03234.1 immunoglobulin light chain junction region [Macaca mulatta]MPO03508.1 immunoglobulin light chain junction region [Macaca mulatta]MPO05286.1 immunoglobulin light chain junction region [Macaca mulatta]MPO06269.1 immunoglobulin light chain junction region [Macaca mulatta]